MEKLTETLNSIKITKSTKDKILFIAEKEEIQIQQVCRRLLTKAINEYFLANNIIDIKNENRTERSK